MEETRHHSLLLILARELAANVATPIFVVDRNGSLVFYNEAAESVLGRPFAGTLAAEEWATMFVPLDLDGSPLAPEELPLYLAFSQLRPGHRMMRITGSNGASRLLSVTAMPLMETPETAAGAMAIFWEEEAD